MFHSDAWSSMSNENVGAFHHDVLLWAISDDVLCIFAEYGLEKVNYLLCHSNGLVIMKFLLICGDGLEENVFALNSVAVLEWWLKIVVLVVLQWISSS